MVPGDRKSVEYLFRFSGVAVVGASANPDKAGHQIVKNMIDAGYPGMIYPVNPKESRIAGLVSYPSVTAIPAGVEMVVISTPAGLIDSVIEDLTTRSTERGDIRAVITSAAGFGETGTPEGKRFQETLIGYCRRFGIRELGPNCVGIIDNVNKIDTTFILGTRRRAGGISLISQSGAVGAWLVSSWSSLPEPVGLNKFISLGNMADVDAVEVLEYLGEDPDTRVIGMYLEGHPRARQLVEAAARIVPKKPVVIMKVGKTSQGMAAAHSHTGSLAGADQVYEGAFRQVGIIRVESIAEMSDALRAFDQLPRLAGNRAFVITQAGGPGIICADELARHPHVEFARLSEETQGRLRRSLPPFASVCHPEGHADITAAATVEQHVGALEVIASDPSADAIVLITVPTLYLPPLQLAKGLVEALGRLRDRGCDKPFLPVILSGHVVEEGRSYLEAQGIPTFETPDRVARVVSNLVRYRAFVEYRQPALARPRVEGGIA